MGVWLREYVGFCQDLFTSRIFQGVHELLASVLWLVPSCPVQLFPVEPGFDLFFGNFLGAEEPVVAFEALFFAFHPALGHAAGTGSGNNHLVTGSPVCRQGDPEVVHGLQSNQRAFDFIEVPAQGERVVNDGADDVLRVDEEDGADGLGIAFAGLDHAVEFGDLHRDVLDEREFHFHVLHPLVFDFFLNRAKPGDMAVKPVHRQSDKLGVQVFEFLGHRGESHELGSADRREICGMAEEDFPFSLEVLGERNRALRAFGLEGRGFVPDAGHRGHRVHVVGFHGVEVLSVFIGNLSGN